MIYVAFQEFAYIFTLALYLLCTAETVKLYHENGKHEQYLSMKLPKQKTTPYISTTTIFFQLVCISLCSYN